MANEPGTCQPNDPCKITGSGNSSTDGTPSVNVSITQPSLLERKVHVTPTQEGYVICNVEFAWDDEKSEMSSRLESSEPDSWTFEYDLKGSVCPGAPEITEPNTNSATYTITGKLRKAIDCEVAADCEQEFTTTGTSVRYSTQKGDVTECDCNFESRIIADTDATIKFIRSTKAGEDDSVTFPSKGSYNISSRQKNEDGEAIYKFTDGSFDPNCRCTKIEKTVSGNCSIVEVKNPTGRLMGGGRATVTLTVDCDYFCIDDADNITDKTETQKVNVTVKITTNGGGNSNGGTSGRQTGGTGGAGGTGGTGQPPYEGEDGGGSDGKESDDGVELNGTYTLYKACDLGTGEFLNSLSIDNLIVPEVGEVFLKDGLCYQKTTGGGVGDFIGTIPDRQNYIDCATCQGESGGTPSNTEAVYVYQKCDNPQEFMNLSVVEVDKLLPDGETPPTGFHEKVEFIFANGSCWTLVDEGTSIPKHDFTEVQSFVLFNSDEECYAVNGPSGTNEIVENRNFRYINCFDPADIRVYGTYMGDFVGHDGFGVYEKACLSFDDLTTDSVTHSFINSSSIEYRTCSECEYRIINDSEGLPPTDIPDTLVTREMLFSPDGVGSDDPILDITYYVYQNCNDATEKRTYDVDLGEFIYHDGNCFEQVQIQTSLGRTHIDRNVVQVATKDEALALASSLITYEYKDCENNYKTIYTLKDKGGSIRNGSTCFQKTNSFSGSQGMALEFLPEFGTCNDCSTGSTGARGSIITNSIDGITIEGEGRQNVNNNVQDDTYVVTGFVTKGETLGRRVFIATILPTGSDFGTHEFYIDTEFTNPYKDFFEIERSTGKVYFTARASQGSWSLVYIIESPDGQKFRDRKFFDLVENPNVDFDIVEAEDGTDKDTDFGDIAGSGTNVCIYQDCNDENVFRIYDTDHGKSIGQNGRCFKFFGFTDNMSATHSNLDITTFDDCASCQGQISSAVLLSNSVADLSENSKDGFFVGNLSTVDPDSVFFYYEIIQESGTNFNEFSLNNSRLLTTSEVLPGLRSVKIRSLDESGNSVVKTFNIIVSEQSASINTVASNNSIDNNPSEGDSVSLLNSFNPGKRVDTLINDDFSNGINSNNWRTTNASFGTNGLDLNWSYDGNSVQVSSLESTKNIIPENGEFIFDISYEPETNDVAVVNDFGWEIGVWASNMSETGVNLMSSYISNPDENIGGRLTLRNNADTLIHGLKSFDAIVRLVKRGTSVQIFYNDVYLSTTTFDGSNSITPERIWLTANNSYVDGVASSHKLHINKIQVFELED